MNRILTTCLGFALLFLPAVALAGSYGTASIHGNKDWRSTACSKPAQPQLAITSQASYNEAVLVYNKYIVQVQEYAECVNKEASKDAKTVIKAINEGSAKAVKKAQKELKEVLGYIDAHHPHNKSM